VSDGGLAQFLADRYDEAEALARAWQSPPWGEDATSWKVVGRREPRYDNGCSETLTAIDVSGRPVNFAEAIQVRWDSNGERTPYIAANDPAHRLADIALKRAILALHASAVTKTEQYRYDPSTGEPIPERYDGDCGICGWFDPEQGGCATVRQLGTEFADHPAYKESWKP
jgi:hypothetical protein